MIRRKQDRRRAPDRLRFRVAEDPCGPAVPTADDARPRIADNGIVGGLYDRRQSTLRRFGAQRLVGNAQFDFGALVFGDFLFQGGIGGAQRSRARQAQCGRNQFHQQNRGRNRGQRRERLEAAAQPVKWAPDDHDFHQVRQAAGHNENRETDEHPVEFKITAAPDKVEQREWNGEVGQSDQEVGCDMQPEDPRLPEVAHAVRHESVAGEYLHCAKQSNWVSTIDGSRGGKLGQPI